MQLFLKRRDGKAEAKGEFGDGVFTVKKGSRIKIDSSGNLKGFKKADLARSDASIVGSDGTVKKDVTFNSPSMAAAFVLGQSANGYVTWKDKDKRTLKELVNEQ